jgi:hypothetical protein
MPFVMQIVIVCEYTFRNEESDQCHALSRKKFASPKIAKELDLHLGETVLPDGHEWRNTILAVVKEDDPTEICISRKFLYRLRNGNTYMPSGSIDSPT